MGNFRMPRSIRVHRDSPDWMKTMGDIFNGGQLAGGILRTGTDVIDSGGVMVGAGRGVGHTAGGAYEQRRGYHYAARGNANRAEAYSIETGAALEHIKASEEYKNQGKSHGHSVSATDDSHELDNKEERLLRRIARNEKRGNFEKADKLSEKLLKYDQEKHGGEHFNDAVAQQNGGVQKAAPINRQAETEKFIDAMLAANNAAPGSDAQTAALTAAHHAAENCKGPDGKVHFADTQRTFGQGRNAKWFAIGIDPATGHDYAIYESPEAAMKNASSVLANQSGQGRPVNPQMIDAIGQGRKVADAKQQKTETQGNADVGATQDKVDEKKEAKEQIVVKEQIVHRSVFDIAQIPNADGGQAKIYNADVVKAGEMPKISPNQVEAVQAMLGVEVDGKWGKKTQAAYLAACKKANLDPASGLDFTAKDNLAVAEVLKKGEGYEAVAAAHKPAPTKAGPVVAETKETNTTGTAAAEQAENNVLTSKTGAAVTQTTPIITVGADISREVPDETVVAGSVDKPKTMDGLAEELKKTGVGDVQHTASLEVKPMVPVSQTKAIEASAERSAFLDDMVKGLSYTDGYKAPGEHATDKEKIKSLEKFAKSHDIDGIKADGVMTQAELNKIDQAMTGNPLRPESLDKLLAAENIKGGYVVVDVKENGNPPPVGAGVTGKEVAQR